MSAKWGNSAINEIKFKQNGVTNDVKKVQKAKVFPEEKVRQRKWQGMEEEISPRQVP